MAEYIGNTIPNPGLSINNPGTTDQELKYSSNGGGFTQKGGLIKGGQGVLLIGTVLARETSTRKWVKYASGGSDGANVATAILRKTVDTTAGDVTQNLVFAGILKYNLVSSANGAQLAAAVTGLSARANVPLNLFSF